MLKPLTVCAILTLSAVLIRFGNATRSVGVSPDGSETIREKIRKEKRFVVFNSRRLTGECLPVCVDKPVKAIELTETPTGQPTLPPTTQPTASPTSKPTASPTTKPTASPTTKPTASPTASPTNKPTASPTNKPTASPTNKPTASPTAGPTSPPTLSPTNKPTASPTASPTAGPTSPPTLSPTNKPTASPTAPPTASPTNKPTASPTASPTSPPTASPTNKPTAPPTPNPTASPTNQPTAPPTQRCYEVVTKGIMRPIELVFAIDSSGSMEVNSPTTDPNRLRVTAVQTFIDKLKSDKDKVGVVSWNGCGSVGNAYERDCDNLRNEVDPKGYLSAAQFESLRGSKNRNSMQSNPIQFVEPMTNNMAHIRSVANVVNSDGVTNPDLGMKVAIDMMGKGATALDGERVIVFLTDGMPRGDVDGVSNTLTDIGDNCNIVASPAYDAKVKGYTIYTVGLGGGDIRAADEDKLERWAQCTGGTYTKASNANALAAVYQAIYKDVEAKASTKIVCEGS